MDGGTPVRHRTPLAAVLTANSISTAGTSLTLIGVPWFVLETTGSAGRAGVVAFCATLPIVVAALIGGPVIDRIGRRRVSVASDAVCGAAVGAVPLLHHAGALEFGMLNPILTTVTYERVPEELRSRVSGALTAGCELAMPVGGLAAGLLVEGAGATGALLAMGGVYFLATLSPLVLPAWRDMEGPKERTGGPGSEPGPGSGPGSGPGPEQEPQVSSSGPCPPGPGPAERTPRSSVS
ncbi:MFS transporter [Streptomyces sp. NPDC056749]|uniref:MFS transporter n=1 Tax=Streptomyces sp. NPDC056749 TaxID=3345936 RepID=UPI0036BFA65D